MTQIIDDLGSAVARGTALRLAPRKVPRQKRACLTVEAILDACAQLLAVTPYAGLTTNHVSERAGVSIGTLYEYFPSRESIVAALAARSYRVLADRGAAAAAEAQACDHVLAAERLFGACVEVFADPRNAFRPLMLQASFVQALPEAREALERLEALVRTIILPPGPKADGWLMVQMLRRAMIDIAFRGADAADRARLVRELAQLSVRMGRGQDPGVCDYALA